MSKQTRKDKKTELSFKWNEYHLKSLDCKTEEDEEDFCRWFTLDIKHFICKECRPHAQQILKLNPIEKYRGLRDQNGNLVGLFKYTHLFHNLVNRRLEEPTMLYEDAFNKYSRMLNNCSNVCTSSSKSKKSSEEKDRAKSITSSERSKISSHYLPLNSFVERS